MKVFATLSLLFLLLFQIFLKAGIIGFYQINKTFITANFCENRETPEMQCNGKCYLSKQLKKADEKNDENQLPPVFRDLQELPPFITGEISSQQITTLSISLFQPASSRLFFNFAPGVFHPPAI